MRKDEDELTEKEKEVRNSLFNYSPNLKKGYELWHPSKTS